MGEVYDIWRENERGQDCSQWASKLQTTVPNTQSGRSGSPGSRMRGGGQSRVLQLVQRKYSWCGVENTEKIKKNNPHSVSRLFHM